MEIEVINETEEKEINSLLEELEIYLKDVAKEEKLENILYNVIIVDNEEIRRLNREYRNKDSVTDVISFALEDDETSKSEVIRVLGDIYISIDKARSQSIEYGHSLKRELFFLATHGFLHLLGYDHMKEEEEKIMFAKQEEVLNRHGISKEKEER